MALKTMLQDTELVKTMYSVFNNFNPMLSHFHSVEPIFLTNVAANDSQQFAFVTIRKPSDLKQKARQSLIRKHAKQDVDRAKARRQRATIEQLRTVAPERANHKVAANISKLRQSRVIRSPELPRHNDATALLTLNQEKGHDDCTFPETDRRLLHLSTYPVKPNARIVQLFEFMMTLQNISDRSIHLMWVRIAMFDQDSFNLTLASASNMLAQSKDPSCVETTESMNFYTASVEAVSRRLQDPRDRVSNELVGTILGFTCLDVTYGNWQRWEAHMNGIHQILLLRGGLSTIHTSFELSMTAFCNEISGSLVLDRQPRFPVSIYVKPTVQIPGGSAPEQDVTWLTGSSALSLVIKQIERLSKVAKYIDEGGLSVCQTERENFTAHDVNPIVHGLLSLPRTFTDRETPFKASNCKIAEMLRLASLIFAGLLRRFCYVEPDGVQQNTERLASLLTDDTTDWSPCEDYKVWVLLIVAVSSMGDRRLYIAKLASMMRQRSICSWDDLIATAKRVAWSEIMRSDEGSALEVELLSSISALPTS